MSTEDKGTRKKIRRPGYRCPCGEPTEGAFNEYWDEEQQAYVEYPVCYDFPACCTD